MVLNVFSFSIEEYEKLFLKICGNPQLQASKFFGSNIWKFLALAPKWFGQLKIKNHCIICATRLPHKLCL